MHRWYQGSMINATMSKWLAMHSFGRLLHSSRNFLTHSVSHTPNPNKLKYWREPCVGVSLWSVGVISFNRRDVTLNESGTVYGCSPYLVKAQLSDNLKAKKEICFKIQAPVSLPSSSRLKLLLLDKDPHRSKSWCHREGSKNLFT